MINKNMQVMRFSTSTVILILAILLLSTTAKSQSQSNLIYDTHQSQQFGSYNLITLHHVLYSFEDKNIPDTLFREDNFIKKAGGFGYRMTKLLLLDVQVDGFIALTQHEAFGHGSRYREFGYKENSFNLNLSPPFGTGGGFARRGTLKKGYTSPSYQENIAMAIGGVDSQMLLANDLASQMLLDDTLHYRQGLLYLISQNNLLFYLWSTHFAKPENIKPGNDMIAYINGVNSLYVNTGGSYYSTEKLSTQSLVSIVNPLQFYSLFSILYTYGIKGEKQLKEIPMIKFGNVRYLPAFNYSLTPFGSQYHFMNYIRYKRILFSGDFTFGEKTFNDFYGVSLKGYNIVDKKRITLNFHLDIWNQPELELETYIKPTGSNKTGAAFKMDFTLRPYNGHNRLGLFLQTGYKAKGYITGDPLDESFILRYGISLHL